MTTLALIALFAVALNLGGMVFFAALVAPLVFRVLPAEHGGRFIRALFPRYYIWVGGTAAAAAVALFPVSYLAAGLMTAVAAMTVWLRQSLMPRINALSDRAKAGDTAAQAPFDRAHRLSVVANVLQMAVAIAVLAGFVL